LGARIFVTVADLGEHALLARVLARLPRPPASVLVGPGDDAAIVAPTRNERLVVTTDALVEGVHFSRPSFAPADVGHKVLAANLSDLAAMGAAPRWALMSLVLPDSTLVADVEALVDGCAALARTYGVAIVGGNIARTTGPMVIDVTAGGEVRPRRWLTRGGARAGDDIYVSGTIGAAGAGLEMLREEPRARSREPKAGACVARQLRPEPRVALGLAVGRARAARAAMDLSDGLADALRQVAAASGCGVRVDAAAIPIDEGARAWWDRRGVDSVRAALGGGEDYELLFAVPKQWSGRLRLARRHVASPPLARIGEFTREAGVLTLERDGRREELPAGFEHFR
jgi:thiamine-monophosphate kinase